MELARAEAEKASLAKSDFLTCMSHDLRAPLNTILGFAQLIDSDTPPPTLAQTASVEQILRSGWYLLELINEIVDLSQIEAGNLVLSMQPTSLTEVLRECHAMIAPLGRKRGITMTFPPSGIPYFVNADRTRLKQVLISLLSNAIKYNRLNGTVVVECAMSTSVSTPERIRVSIGDTGAGLSPDMMPQLFQPFNRLGRERSAEEGTGIGLVMSKRLVELMGGVIGAESTVGSGSVFWFELNSSVEPRLETDGAQTAIVEVPVRHGAPVRSTLLYVEDNPANLKLIEQLIARSPDIALLTARDGLEGVELARANQPDVILMDINLPGISGIGALKILREDPVTAHIPVVALSANAMLGDIEKALQAGFFRYLTKPIKVRELMETLEVALEFAALGRGR
jgi:CheY-like chemotaxis protein